MSDDPLRPHVHEPNPLPPDDDVSIVVRLPNGRFQTLTVGDLKAMPYNEVHHCYIVSTGHGTSGPFTFGGVRIGDLMQVLLAGEQWDELEVISADGFGNRIFREEAADVLLAYTKDNQPLTRQQGLVRLIVPSEKKDALRQVKWVRHLNIVLNES
ncbi:MAG: hypothetical protein Kow0080_34240 [Candidatus Promineifilaceae bacterium]